MKKQIIFINIILIGMLFINGGCRWFADNPMFPTGKFEVSYRVMDERGDEAPTGILGVVSVTDITSTSDSSSSSSVNTEITESYTVTVNSEGEVSTEKVESENSSVQASEEALSSKRFIKLKLQ